MGDRAGEGRAYLNLGNTYRSQGDFRQAIEYHAQHLAIAQEVGDRAGYGQAYGNLGSAYQSHGDFSKAIALHTQHLAIAKEVGDRFGEGSACANLGNAHDWQGEYAKAIEYHAQHLAIAKEVGDRAQEGQAYRNLGSAYQSQGDFSKAIAHHAQHLAIAKEVGDRAGEGEGYGYLGNLYLSQGDFSQAIEHHAQSLAIAKEVDDRAGVSGLRASIQLSDAALNMGVALTFQVRAARQGPATGADQAPGPHSHSSVSACRDDRVREAAKWLQAAFDDGRPFAKLHLAHLTFYAGQEDAALAHLKEHLSWRVQRGRHICAGCGQTRGEDTPMLTCSGCRVARFCSADHQKMASKNFTLGGSLWDGRHKDICGVLGKWREVVNDRVEPDSCTADLVAFLQR